MNCGWVYERLTNLCGTVGAEGTLVAVLLISLHSLCGPSFFFFFLFCPPE